MPTAPDRFFVETRAELAGNTLKGYAAVFDGTARVGGGYERIAPNAFDEALKRAETRPGGVAALINHNPSMLLGRSTSGTLRLSTDSRGLAFAVDLPDTTDAHNLRALVERGDLAGASFGFIPGDDEITRAPDGKQVRTHTNIAELVDVSAVTYPAYEGTSLTLRHIEFGRVARPRLQALRIRARHL